MVLEELSEQNICDIETSVGKRMVRGFSANLRTLTNNSKKIELNPDCGLGFAI